MEFVIWWNEHCLPSIKVLGSLPWVSNRSSLASHLVWALESTVRVGWVERLVVWTTEWKFIPMRSAIRIIPLGYFRTISPWVWSHMLLCLSLLRSTSVRSLWVNGRKWSLRIECTLQTVSNWLVKRLFLFPLSSICPFILINDPGNIEWLLLSLWSGTKLSGCPLLGWCSDRSECFWLSFWLPPLLNLLVLASVNGI